MHPIGLIIIVWLAGGAVHMCWFILRMMLAVRSALTKEEWDSLMIKDDEDTQWFTLIITSPLTGWALVVRDVRARAIDGFFATLPKYKLSRDSRTRLSDVQTRLKGP